VVGVARPAASSAFHSFEPWNLPSQSAAARTTTTTTTTKEQCAMLFKGELVADSKARVVTAVRQELQPILHLPRYQE
jgi:hypothetical protein